VHQQNAIFEEVADRLGRAPPVVDTADVLADPSGVLGGLCERLGIAFDPAMLSWRPGPRASDGVWAPAWYKNVWASTGFGPPDRRPLPRLDGALARMAEAARPAYERLARHRIRV